jgi:nitric oxide reductase subunit C
MNKRQTRLFAIVSTALASLAFLGLTIDSHRQFKTLTHPENITPEVSHGQDVWHAKNCINCHTLFGEGAYYAPDLTKITQLRGAPYLTAFLRNPGNFYNEREHRRVMPRQDLSDTEIADLIAFLDWVSKVDNGGWPERPILVAGTSIPGMNLSTSQQARVGQEKIGLPPGARPISGNEDPMALGRAYFTSVQPSCSACHSIAPNVNLAGPSLAGIATRTEQLLKSGDYKGSATDVAGYIRESIEKPSAYVVPGSMYSSNGQSFMPTTFKETLTSDKIDALVAFLITLK